MKKNCCQKSLNRHYLIAFWVTLVLAIGLISGGALTPPRFVIDGSIFTAVGLLFLWPTLAFGAKAVEDGRIARFRFGHGSINIGQDSDGNGLDDNYERSYEYKQTEDEQTDNYSE